MYLERVGKELPSKIPSIVNHNAGFGRWSKKLFLIRLYLWIMKIFTFRFISVTCDYMKIKISY